MANEIEEIKVALPDSELVTLADKIVQVVEEGKKSLALSINETIKTTYWKIGQYIVEFEDKEGVLMLAHEGHHVQTPEDVVKI